MKLFYLIAIPFFAFCNDAEDVRNCRLAQNEAIAGGNIELTASFWTDDVTLRRGLGHSITGKDQYAESLGKSGTLFIRKPDEIEVSLNWPLAFETGKWEGSFAGGKISGSYAAQWVKRDDQWLIRSEVFVALEAEGEALLLESLP
jgi:ketosteroid isomerase-like protein